MYLKFISKYLKKVDKAKASISSEMIKGIKKRMGSLKNKASTAEIGKKAQQIWKDPEQETKAGGSRTCYRH